MKRNIVASVIAVAMIAATLTGCAGTTQVAETPAPEKEETVVAEPTPAPETTETVETPEVVEEPEEEVAAEPEREVKTWDSQGTTILSYDPENEYVAKIREAFPDCDDYQGAFIVRLDDGGFIFYFEPEDGDTTEYFNLGAPGEDVEYTDEENQKCDDNLNTMAINYIQDGDNGVAPKVDLDGDGKVTLYEAFITSLFADNGRTNFKVSGCLIADYPGEEAAVIWDNLAAPAEETAAE